MKAWHFVKDDRTLQFQHNGKYVKIHKGLSLSVDPDELEMCKCGLHASKNILDALTYTSGSVVCRVELSGKIIEDYDKVVAERRKVLWWVDADKILHEFACWCAERALKRARVTDERCWNAILAKRRWLKGQITDNELYAVWVAVWVAAWGAVWDATWAATWDVMRDATKYAAWATARGVVWDSARGTVRDAVWDVAERKAQSCKLISMINKARWDEQP